VKVLTSMPVVECIRFSATRIYAVLADGRELGIPIAWSWRLSDATRRQRANYVIEERGTAIHWPDVDEDIGLAAFLGIHEDVITDDLR
jgi:hypothetical protein